MVTVELVIRRKSMAAPNLSHIRDRLQTHSALSKSQITVVWRFKQRSLSFTLRDVHYRKGITVVGLRPLVTWYAISAKSTCHGLNICSLSCLFRL